MSDQLHYLLFGNPFCQKLIATSKSILFKNGNSGGVSTIATQTKQVVNPVILSLYQQGGNSSKVFIRIAGFSGAAAVILGAYGAHKVDWPETHDPKRDPKSIFEVANKYHFYNSLALMAVPLVKRPWLTGSLMVSGIVLFSGTCYYAAITGDQRFNRLAPLGGTSLILAWVSMMFF